MPARVARRAFLGYARLHKFDAAREQAIEPGKPQSARAKNQPVS